jgi:hypothetical protein
VFEGTVKEVYRKCLGIGSVRYRKCLGSV